MAVLLLCGLLAATAGCGRPDPAAGHTKVLACFGRAGQGPLQFMYPRAITIADDGTLFVVDKTARIQHLTPDGRYLDGWTMPQYAAGKPIGLNCGPDGNVYVADTHYHRVMVYSPSGDLLRKFGDYGTADGQMIYPTDVAVAPDGRIFVSEYGGNDRVSIFGADGSFLTTFGSFGQKEGQFARPSAMCLDRKRQRLYIADACNHRIIRCNLDGELQGVIGQMGTQLGQLRYPYDVNLLSDGSLIVCEFGNNRVQQFDANGTPVAVFGQPGRELGQLVYPWGAVADAKGRLFVVDSGNNRVQVWRI